MDIAEIIIKKLKGQLSVTEQETFVEWLESSPENRELFNRLELIKLKTGNLPDIENLDPSAAFNRILSKSKSKTKKRLARSIMKYAAASIIFIVGGYGVWQYSQPKAVINPCAVTLDMGDGEIISLSEQKQQNITDNDGNIIGKSTQNEITYNKAANKPIDIASNLLKVPNGKTFKVRLSDGTLVHMNAGSSLKYPSAFSLKGFRNVTLTGEAFFEVSKDKKHPFVVNVNKLDITVLGTKFNVSSYPEDISVKTVLVEGSVKLAEKGNKAQFLKPGYEADWHPNSKNIKFSKVDTSIATMWMEKGLVIREMPFNKIITKLERYYGVTIENKNKNISNEIYTAEFKDQNIEEVLSTFQFDTDFKYKIENKKITIY